MCWVVNADETFKSYSPSSAVKGPEKSFERIEMVANFDTVSI